MNDQEEDILWQKLSRRLFNGNRIAADRLFTARVMSQIRLSQKERTTDWAWHRYLKWAMPLAGVGLAGLLLAARTPPLPMEHSLDGALFQQQTADEDPLSGVLEVFR